MVAFADVLQRWTCVPPPAPAKQCASDEPLSYDAAVAAAMAEFGQDPASQAHFGLVTTRFKYAGYVILNLVWGFFAWIVFAP